MTKDLLQGIKDDFDNQFGNLFDGEESIYNDVKNFMANIYKDGQQAESNRILEKLPKKFRGISNHELLREYQLRVEGYKWMKKAIEEIVNFQEIKAIINDAHH